MARKFTEQKLKEQYPDFEERLVKLLNEGGQAFAAFRLGTRQSTISLIIKRSNRIKRVTRYELQEPQAS